MSTTELHYAKYLGGHRKAFELQDGQVPADYLSSTELLGHLNTPEGTGDEQGRNLYPN